MIESSPVDGLAKLRWLDRPTGRVIRRIEPTRCGDLVHVDIKKLGKIPAGGGWRMLGPAVGKRNHQAYKAGQKSNTDIRFGAIRSAAASQPDSRKSPNSAAPMAPPPRHPRVLRPPRLQRPHRSHQRTPGSTAPQRPRIQKPYPLPLALTTAPRRPALTPQCTLNYEEPQKRHRHVRTSGLAAAALAAVLCAASTILALRPRVTKVEEHVGDHATSRRTHRTAEGWLGDHLGQAVEAASRGQQLTALRDLLCSGEMRLRRFQV